MTGLKFVQCLADGTLPLNTIAKTLGYDMETYRIIPLGHAYRAEAAHPNGQTRVVRTWPTEEAAVSHLKALREVAERFGRALQPSERDWRG
jgi:hypothetical protein